MNLLTEAIEQVESLIKVLKKGKSRQVGSSDEKSLVKTIAFTWFKNIRPSLPDNNNDLKSIDQMYTTLLELSDKFTTRTRYFTIIKDLRKSLINIRSQSLLNIKENNNSLEPPSFDSLISDQKMQSILKSRWTECIKCIDVDAPLSAIVMMGGILEAILLARVNNTVDKSIIFKSSFAPIVKNTGKVQQLKEWTLRHYIDVAHDLGWISQSTKDIGETLRDYRNYVHPYKEYSHGIKIEKSDAELFWQITVSIIKQVLIVK